MSKKIGILALQGDFAEHIQVFHSLGADAFEVRTTDELSTADALVIPGGESTAVATLENVLPEIGHAKEGMFDAIKRHVNSGMPVWGTCMGSIILAKNIEGSGQGRIGLMNITVRRNAFGPQKFSSEHLLDIPVVGAEPFPGFFIRAPLYIHAENTVNILCSLGDGFVMAKENNILATAFHPEITGDARIHSYFLNSI